MGLLEKHITQAAKNVENILNGVRVEVSLIPSEVELFQVCIGGREDYPIYVTNTDRQLICLCYLWQDSDIRPEKRLALLESMLDLNVPIPLSSFGRIGQQHVLFGALSKHASVDDVAHELLVLSDNAVDAMSALAEYLY